MKSEEDKEIEEHQETPALLAPTPPSPVRVLSKGEYPAGLALELVLSTLPPEEILAAYNLSADEFKKISRLPAFRKEFKELQEAAKDEGFAYKMKAKAQAEGMLQTTWEMVHNQMTPAAVRADLIKFMARVAGYDIKEARGNDY
jgi:hypothetical protein